MEDALRRATAAEAASQAEQVRAAAAEAATEDCTSAGHGSRGRFPG